jgi:hypothetical protein
MQQSIKATAAVGGDRGFWRLKAAMDNVGASRR